MNFVRHNKMLLLLFALLGFSLSEATMQETLYGGCLQDMDESFTRHGSKGVEDGCGSSMAEEPSAQHECLCIDPSTQKVGMNQTESEDGSLWSGDGDVDESLGNSEVWNSWGTPLNN